jgi:hypothetical protein
MQSGWPEFCRRVALPLRDALAAPATRPPRNGEILVTRARVDWLFRRALGLAVVPSLCVAAVAENAKYALTPLLLAIPWLVLRQRTPLEGSLQPAFSEQPQVRRFACRLLACAGLLLFALVCRSEPGRIILPHAEEISQFAYILCGLGLAVIFADAKRRCRAQRQQAAAAAVLLWEQGSPA